MEYRGEKHEGHRERLRQRVLSSSLEALEPHELIEFLLYYVIPRQDVNELAHDLLNRFADLKGVLQADIQELMQVKGLGQHAAQWLHLVGECSRACGQLLPEDWMVLSNFKEVSECVRQIRPEIAPPCVVQLCMDRINRLLHRGMLGSTARWGDPGIMRSAISDVFTARARNVVLLVFTQRKDLTPTPYDIFSAGKYASMLSYAGCSLMDVILVGENSICSMHRYDLIPDQSDSKRMSMVREDYMRIMLQEDPFPTY